MLEGFAFSTPTIASQLTGTLVRLRHYNALSIPPEFFMEAMGRLRDKYLNVPLDAVLHPASLVAQRAADEQKGSAETAPAVGGEVLTAQQWFERGFNSGDLGEKQRFYSQAIRLKPDYPEAFNNRGNARGKSGDIEGAIRDFDEAIRLKPDSARAFNNRGNARSSKDDLGGAIQDYTEAIRLKPDYPIAFMNRGATRGKTGDLEGALQDFNEAIRLKPDYAEAIAGREELLKTMSDTVENSPS